MFLLRFVFHTLRRSPGTALVAVITIALGVGANSAVFTLADAILLRPLPVERPGELVLLSPRGYFPGSEVNQHSLSYPEYRHLRDRAEAFSGLLCRFQFTANIRGHDRAERLAAELVSGNYFATLGVGATIGRTIGLEDDIHPGAHPVAVLSHDYWVTRFGARADVIGQTLHLNGQAFTIVGVSAPGFGGVELDHRPAVRIPMMMAEQVIPHLSWIKLEQPGARWVQAIGRLRPGVSAAVARAALQPLYQHSLAELAAALNADDQRKLRQSTLEISSAELGLSELRKDWTGPLGALTAMVGLVLALTCVNLANLHIARAAQREGELALRMALGASRPRVIAQLVAESLVLATIGGAAGLVLAAALAEQLLPFLAGRDGPANLALAFDWRFLGAGLGLTTMVVLASGLAPAVLSTRLDLMRVLRRAGAFGSAGARLRHGLVVAQISLSLVLLIGSGLFLRSLRKLNHIELGFHPTNVVVFGFDAILNGYPRARVEADYRRLQAKLEELPGVDSVAYGLVRVIDGSEWITGVAVHDPAPGPDQPTVAALNAISPGYCRTLGMPLLRGREFTEADGEGSPPVALVNQAFARRFFGHEEVVGRRISVPDPRGVIDMEIVGLVRDAKYDTLVGSAPAQLFVPYPQLFTAMGMNCYVRSRLPVPQLTEAIRKAVHAIDPTVPVHALRTLDQQRDRALTRERLLALVASSFAALATLLAGLGLYGLLSFSVARRTREIGLRIALGGEPSAIVRLVLRQGLRATLAGLLIGLGGAALAARICASQLYGVRPDDPVIYAASATVLALVTLAACWMPARRASLANPVEALRAE